MINDKGVVKGNKGNGTKKRAKFASSIILSKTNPKTISHTPKDIRN